jgi:hypothetical protein
VKKVKGFKHGKELKRRKRIKEEQGKGLATWKSKEQGGSLATWKSKEQGKGLATWKSKEQGKGLATWKSKEQGGSLAGIKVCGELARRIYI